MNNRFGMYIYSKIRNEEAQRLYRLRATLALAGLSIMIAVEIFAPELLNLSL